MDAPILAIGQRDVDEATFTKADHLSQESAIIVTGTVKEEPRAIGGYEMVANGLEVVNEAHDQDKGEEKVVVQSDPTKPFVGLAFKLQQDKYGQLTYFRVYQGSVTSGDTIYNISNEMRKVRVPRMFRMHSDDREEVPTAEAGDNAAIEIEIGQSDLRYSRISASNRNRARTFPVGTPVPAGWYDRDRAPEALESCRISSPRTDAHMLYGHRRSRCPPRRCRRHRRCLCRRP